MARLAANTSRDATACPTVQPSDRQRLLQRRLVHRLAPGAVDHGAAIHHLETVAQLAGEVQILLDQHDGDLAERAEIRDGAADILDDRGLNPFGRLGVQQGPRPPIPSTPRLATYP